MFGKFFASAFEGSMRGAGSDVFALWAYVLSHTVRSRVEINVEDVAPRIGMSVEAAEKALAYLQQPDHKSRSLVCDGCRMVKEGAFSYFIPNHQAYLLIKTSEDLRRYNAGKQREHRARVNKAKAVELSRVLSGERGREDVKEWCEGGIAPSPTRIS